MIDVYRTSTPPPPPACMNCMTHDRVSLDVMWDWWICMLCGETWDPDWRGPSARTLTVGTRTTHPRNK